jgi:hypothetical protein
MEDSPLRPPRTEEVRHILFTTKSTKYTKAEGKKQEEISRKSGICMND